MPRETLHILYVIASPLIDVCVLYPFFFFTRLRFFFCTEKERKRIFFFSFFILRRAQITFEEYLRFFKVYTHELQGKILRIRSVCWIILFKFINAVKKNLSYDDRYLSNFFVMFESVEKKFFFPLRLRGMNYEEQDTFIYLLFF